MVEENYIGHRRDTGEEVAFPVDWPNAADAERTWRWDAEHNPYPLTPLSQEFNTGGTTLALAAESLGATATPPMPVITANGYRYNGGRGGFGSPTPAYLETVAALAPRINELWDHGWRIEIEARAREVAGFDYDSLSLTNLVNRLESMVEGMRDSMILMFRAGHLVSSSRAELLRFCEVHIGRAAESLVNDLLQGNPTVSLDSGAALWEVAQLLSQSAEAVEHLQRQANAEGLASLPGIDGSTEFLNRFNEWLETYGHRNGSFGELAEPTWFEDPQVPIGLLLQSIHAEDPRVSQQKAIKVREQLQNEFEKRLRDPDEISRFRGLLATSAPYLGVRESRDHATNMALTAIRVPALAIGRRLVDGGAIEKAEDVFFLGFRDLEAAAGEPQSDLRTGVSERREVYDYWRNIAPPDAIGASAPGYFDARYVRGVAASGGVATGVARVIMNLAEAHTLRAGDVLVTRATTPAWTPLFGVASAVVTEGGGALSHCAILAREYGIPAVVGASGATHRIQDGATITVDGAKGRVKIDDLSDCLSG